MELRQNMQQRRLWLSVLRVFLRLNHMDENLTPCFHRREVRPQGTESHRVFFADRLLRFSIHPAVAKASCATPSVERYSMLNHPTLITTNTLIEAQAVSLLESFRAMNPDERAQCLGEARAIRWLTDDRTPAVAHALGH